MPISSATIGGGGGEVHGIEEKSAMVQEWREERVLLEEAETNTTVKTSAL
jgi:hypothetical protein